jgi:hypothetical protein
MKERKVIASCNAEGQCLPPVLILKAVKKKEEFANGLPCRAEVYINPKSLTPIQCFF